MARKVQISKEVILQAALEMLIEDGYLSINIKTLSKKIGCSTQPLVWHFENMEGLRKALAEYALAYANNKMCPTAENAIEAFEQVGTAFVRIAVKEPNLFRFLYLEGRSDSTIEGFDALTEDDGNPELIRRISHHLQISEECTGRYLQNTIVYTYGMATLAATGIIKTSEKEMMQMINQAADAFLAQEGVPFEKLVQHKHMEEKEK